MKITHYSFGKIVVDGTEYTKDLIVFPDAVIPSWWRKEGHSLCIEDLNEVFTKDIKILVVGTGAYERMQVPQSLIEELKQRGIETIVSATEKAVALFNQLLSEGKAVAGAFHLTC
ncbi:Mth938-like domain-containing protein [Thermodesulfovibrio aggregans]|uniref:Mth938-like domain-containing protein n=1 Tax=Thermodesulfovibrio aggregans TaxID=86166 RepID=UPI000743BA7A|nr:Mth938-like domain-containing protein [Thermodesulfovibrio aggregans]